MKGLMWAAFVTISLGVAVVLGAGAASLAAGNASASPDIWTSLEPGLDYAELQAPQPSDAGDSMVRILRVDPQRFTLRLLNASAPNQDRPLSAKEWCRQHDLVAAINASMYQTDYRTSVSLMKTAGHTNNPRLTRDKAVLAFDRRDDDVPPVQIIDRQHQNFEALSNRYGSLVQSIRMVSLTGQNVWEPQARKWSTAAIGIDRQGRVLFIHVNSPYATHDLINVLLALPIDLRNAMYTEGGAEAQLYVRSGDREIELVGRYDTGIMGTDANPRAWPIPNAIGVTRIPAKEASAEP